MFRTLLKLVALGMVLVLGGAGVGIMKVQDFLHRAPSTEHDERIVEIPSGATARKVAELLYAEGVITQTRAFYYLARWRGVAGNIRAGEFRFYTDQLPDEVLETLVHGEEVTYRISIPEGYRIQEMKRVVESVGFLNGATFEAITRDPEMCRKLGVQAPTLEGFLFPDTYLVTRRMSEEKLVEGMVRRFQQVWTPEFEGRAREIGMTQLQVVTLASIVEKETGVPEERPLIGSVFHNRLKLGMKLESDPTIIYGLPNYDGDIRSRDIRSPHPWNTYVIPGLPPSPIASPGEEAIRAVLWPAESKYLFFVSRNNRTHDFSETYAQHAALVEQLRRR